MAEGPELDDLRQHVRAVVEETQLQIWICQRHSIRTMKQLGDARAVLDESRTRLAAARRSLAQTANQFGRT